MLESEYQDAYGETFFYTIFRISNYCVQKSDVQVYISPSLFITARERPGPSGHVVWGIGLECVNAETMGLNSA
jgi:hypothetical protein